MNKDPNSRSGSCPVCFQTDTFKFITIEKVPVHCNVLRSTREEAVAAKRADIVLAYCRHCTHIFNLAFTPEQMDYELPYENSLHYSTHFQNYAMSLARRLVESYDLHEKTIVEIGCGRGDFLNMLCELGNNSCIGFEPSYQNEGFQCLDHRRISIINDFYSDKFADCRTDFIVCRHVLEHIDSPKSLLRMVHSSLCSNAEAIVFFEVPNVEFTLRELGIWDLIYEHCGYFSQASLSYLFSSCDFIIRNIETTFGGQNICLEASPTDISSDFSRGKRKKNDIEKSTVLDFSDRFQCKVNAWKRHIKALAEHDKKMVVWGAGSKGISFLNLMQLGDLFKYIIDVNPNKHGKFIAGGGQEIVAPDFLKEYRPEVVIVMNSIYQREIQRRVHELGLSPQFLYA